MKEQPAGKRTPVAGPRYAGACRYGVYGILLLIGLLWAADADLDRPVAGAADKGYTVVRVVDGDTILVEGSGGRETVRLLGIDAPETSKGKGEPGQPYSRKAQRHLAGLVLNRTVALVVYGRDRYKRILAVVYCDNRDINRAMLQAGLAEVYRGRTPETFDKTPYLQSEADARQSRTGMWRQGDAYVSPIRWKHPR
jgi:micrococcal nuclease